MTLSTDDIFRTTAQFGQSDELLDAARQELARLVDADSYQLWASTDRQAAPFELAGLPALEQAGLVHDGQLLARVNLHQGRLFLTDGAWADAGIRVFPFADESAGLLRHARARRWLANCDVLMDLASGCGHSALATDLPLQLALDVNPRALAYAGLNRVLNALPQQRYVLALNDLQAGIPTWPAVSARKGVLLLANVPFAPAPSPASLPLTSNGGHDGLALQRAVCRAALALRATAPAGVPVRLLVLGMTLGDAAANLWQLPQLVQRELGGADVRWHLADVPRLRRFSESARFGNPDMAQRVLTALANYAVYAPQEAQRRQRRIEFAQLAAAHAAAGRPDLALGIVEVEL